jgi:SAM-dependent methyltransferase
MIVKNEAPVIRRCLDSALPLIDAWLIVDTGSTDGTQEIVREHLRGLKGELHERPWRDFVHNRTEALALARPLGDYSLIIDADDTFAAPVGFALPDLDADSYTVDIHFGAVRYTRPQLVKAALNWRYEGVIHEYLICEAAKTVGHLPIVLTVNQDGARRRDPDTYKRDILVLERAIAQDKDPFRLARYTFYLAQSYRDAGEPRKSIPLYMRRAEMGFWSEEVYCSLLFAGHAMWAVGYSVDEVLEVFSRASASVPGRGEALHAAAHLCRVEQRFAEGYAVAKRGIDLAQPHGLFVEAWIYEYGLLDEYAVCAFWAGRYRDSVDAGLQAVTRGRIPVKELPRFLDNMRHALDRLPPDVEPPQDVPAPIVSRPPSVINLGSGKDFRDDHLNLDIDERWSPDSIVDLSTVKINPAGLRLFTHRFGEVVLVPESIDRIVANDVLEHVPDLVALMTTCLELLRTGGTFAIHVPYDLSFGAWQDPTHVRTFNERSWLYYTDWFWYLGWREARFIVDTMEHVPSPLGVALRAGGMAEEELLRTPRAIDALSVTLRKIALTPEDRDVLFRWRGPRTKTSPKPASTAACPPAIQAFSETWEQARDAYCLWIVSPDGYGHQRAFDYAANIMSAAFSASGGSAPVVRNRDACGDRRPIVLGSHLLSDADEMALPLGSVLFNFEQVNAGSGWTTDGYLSRLARHRVLDYSVRNTRALRASGVRHARHLPIRAMPSQAPSDAPGFRDIDVLFYGSMNERRFRTIEEIKARSLSVVSLFDVYGAELDAVVARAKVVVNIHFYEAAIFEALRVCPLLSRGICVVSEGEDDDPDTADLRDGMTLCGRNEIADRCAELVHDESARDALARRGRAAIMRRSQASILTALFAAAP